MPFNFQLAQETKNELKGKGKFKKEGNDFDKHKKYANRKSAFVFGNGKIKAKVLADVCAFKNATFPAVQQLNFSALC